MYSGKSTKDLINDLPKQPRLPGIRKTDFSKLPPHVDKAIKAREEREKATEEAWNRAIAECICKIEIPAMVLRSTVLKNQLPEGMKIIDYAITLYIEKQNPQITEWPKFKYKFNDKRATIDIAFLSLGDPDKDLLFTLAIE